MNICMIILLMLIVYWKLKNQYNERLTLEYQYKLFDLRDKLRSLAIEGKINKHSWQFAYLDGSISKTVNELNTLNIYMAVFIAIKYRNDKNFVKHKAQINTGVAESQYTIFIYNEYTALIGKYIASKHVLLKVTFISSLLLSHISIKIKEKARKIIGNFTIAPETSEGYEVPNLYRSNAAYC